MKKNWYAVFTKINCEKKVSLLLSKKRIENYCPFNKVDTYSYNKKKSISETIFPGFVFVYISDAEMAYIRQTIEVVSFVYWLGKPAVIKEAEIDKIKYFTNEFSAIKLQKTAVNVQGTASIIQEKNIETGDTFTSLAKMNIQLSLPSLGYMLVAQTEKRFINLAEFNKQDIQMAS